MRNTTIAIGIFGRTFWVSWAGYFGLHYAAYPDWCHIGWLWLGVFPVPLSGYLHL